MFEFFRTPGNIRYSLLSITALIAFIGATDLWRKKLKKRPYKPEINFQSRSESVTCALLVISWFAVIVFLGTTL